MKKITLLLALLMLLPLFALAEEGLYVSQDADQALVHFLKAAQGEHHGAAEAPDKLIEAGDLSLGIPHHGG